MLAIGPRLGEMTTGGYELLTPPRPTQKLIHLHAGAEELGRVYAGDVLLQSSMACAAPALADARAAAVAALGRVDPRRCRRLRRQPAADAGRAARHGRGGEGARPPSARGHRLHQRRRQLQRLAASLLPLPGAAPRRPDPARADLGGDGLRPARRRRRGPARAAAHRRQHRRRRRLPDERAGDGDGDRLRRAGGCSASSSTTAPTARSACTRSASTRAGCRAAISAIRTSRRWPGPTAGRPGSASTAPPPSSRRSQAALASGRPALIHLRLDADVITSRTTLRAIRASAERRAAGKA